MPEICRFYGIVIKMFWDDHAPPHFHAEYGAEQATIAITTLAVLQGHLPARALGLTVEWASARQQELLDLWKLAQALEPLRKLEPLG